MGLETLAPVSNNGKQAVDTTKPYVVEAEITGSAPILFHAWDVDAIAGKAAAAKGSKEKKTDNVESYVFRNKDGEICVPGEYLRMAIVNAARFQQDPRSPRKSAMDLYKAGIVVLDDLCSLGSKQWDYLDRRRVMVQRNGVTRVRPAFEAGWKIGARIQVVLPEYITPFALNEALSMAGRAVGIGDFRPTFGRFQITSFKVAQ